MPDGDCVKTAARQLGCEPQFDKIVSQALSLNIPVASPFTALRSPTVLYVEENHMQISVCPLGMVEKRL